MSIKRSPQPPKVVTIVGGGASAHALIVTLSGRDLQVQLLTRRPNDWLHNVELQLQSVEQEILRTFSGHLTRVSSHPIEVIPNSDIVVLCMPVHAYRHALHRIAKYLPHDRLVCIGTLYGQGGFNWMVKEISKKFTLNHLVTFAVGLLPWICRVREYGRVGVIYGGCKSVNIAAVAPHHFFGFLNDFFFSAICKDWFETGTFHQAENFLSLTLSVDNQIIHPARCFGLYTRDGGKWSKLEEVPYFYRDFDDFSAHILSELDADYSMIRDGVKKHFPDIYFSYMLDYLSLEQLSYQSTNSNIRDSFTTSKTLGAIKPPIRQLDTGEWEIDTSHRFFTDDIDYGLCIAQWIAYQIGYSVPTIDMVVNWARSLCVERYTKTGEKFIKEESPSDPFPSGIPPVYGMETINDIMG